jgi:hypothetical protein
VVKSKPGVYKLLGQKEAHRRKRRGKCYFLMVLTGLGEGDFNHLGMKK